jgi:NADPH:quinone reductase-like Zn-dependent oxidoreductase
MSFTGRELRSTIKDSRLTLSLERVEIDDPADDEIVVRVEAAPINPSDLGLLLGPSDLATLEILPGPEAGLTFRIPEARLASVQGRIGQSMTVGNEGAGTVVAAGRDAASLEGKRVGMIGGAMYADYRRIKAADVIPLPDGATAAEGAAMFVNPLTALGFVETARQEGHVGIIHTAAASNLGQMLQKICLSDGIALINIVRSEEHVAILRGIGASHVLNSKDTDFTVRLAETVGETGATIAFDAIGGGTLGNDILRAMEQAQIRQMAEYSRYGSNVFKQLYIYGALDPSPVVLDRLTFGFQWSASGWLLSPFLQKAGPEVVQRIRSRVVDELTTTFASQYSRIIGLAEALEPEVLLSYERKATGEKFLIDPSKG